MSGLNFAKVFVFLLLILAGTYLALVYITRTPVINDVMPAERAETEWTENIFKNVKAAHVYVCMQKQVEIPSWLDHDVLVADALDYIKNRTHIEYRDHQQHEPDLRHCSPDPMLESPDQLNFITNVTTTRLIKGGQEIPIAIISKYIFRPGYKGSMSSFLRGHPLVYDLSDEATARKSYEQNQVFWSLGSPE